MKRILFSLCLVILLGNVGQAQMWNGQDTLFGNEWIDLDKDYYKFEVIEDGIYRIEQATLQQAGFPISSQPGSSLRLFAFGEEIPLYVTTNGIFGNSDYLEFYGAKHKSQLDQFLYVNAENQQLNPEFSLITDKSAYYLTWDNNGTASRYTDTPNDLGGAGSPAQYFLHESKLVFGDRPYSWSNTDDVRYSNFDEGEGFASAFSVEHNLSIPAPALVANGPQSKLDLRMASDLLEHELEIKFNGTTIREETFYGFGFRKYQDGIDNSSINDDNTLEIIGNFDSKDRFAVAVAQLTYPRGFDFGGAEAFAFNIGNGNKQYFEINNFGTNGSTPVLYDLTHKMRIVANVNNEQVRIVLPQAGSSRDLYLSNNGSSIKTINSLSKINFPDLNSSNANYIIITHSDLNNSSSGTNQVAEYASFRASAQGGSYDVQVIEIDDIYEVFGYGISRHPISMRNFGNFIKKNWINPEMIFLLGKGRDYSVTRTDSQLSDPINASFYIPTFGTPGSDNLLFSSGNESDVPVFPIGRLAATTPEEIEIYLRKAKDMAQTANAPQTIEDRAWMKNILHLSGGDPSIQNTIANNLRNFESIIENNSFGADVTTFYKTSTDPVQISESEEIFDLINNGVSMITFFGHSGTGTFDFNIDNPDNFLNDGKLPLIISLGCYSGNIHTPGQGVSERFVFYQDKGAGSFLATTGPGYISALNVFGREFYQKLGQDNYGDPIAKIIRESLVLLDNSSNLTIRTLVQQLTLNGDPAILMNPHPGPDFIVDEKSVEFSPAVINAQLDSFEIEFDVVNLGLAIEDSLNIQIKQMLPNGEEVLLVNEKFKSPESSTNFKLNLPNSGIESVGQNIIHITLDANNEIPELPSPSAELNNKLINSNGQQGISIFVIDNRAIPIYPASLSLFGKSELELVASTTDGLSPNRSYILQIDTTKLFNSPLKLETNIEQAGGLIKWKPSINLIDETVYYWRISPIDELLQGKFVWEYSSFKYIPNTEDGWSQSHYFQFSENRYENILIDEDSRKFRYASDFIDFTLKVKTFDPVDKPNGFINGNKWSDFFRWNIHESMTVVVFDSTGNIWFNLNPGQFGSVNTTAAKIASYPFPVSTTEERSNLINFIENEIPPNHSVFIYTAFRNSDQDLDVGEWAADSLKLNGKNIFNVLESHGASQVRTLESNFAPYIFAFKKGGEVLEEEKANSVDGTVNMTESIEGFWTEGKIISSLIGPAKSWKNLSLSISEADTDTAFINVFGVNTSTGMEELLDSNVMSSIDLSSISAINYPYLRLEFTSSDSDDKSSPQLLDWVVFYDGYPDAATNANEQFTFESDTLQEGQKFRFSIALENPTNVDLDSLLVSYKLVNNGETNVDFEQLQPISKGNSIVAEYEISTEGRSGLNQFIFEANPNQDQIETKYFNNFIFKSFFVKRDNQNPLLDVTFDGIAIMDGDLVSSTPEIDIQLKDENEYFALNDTSIFKIFLTYPSGEVTRLFFLDDHVEFIPASADKNIAYIRMTPTFEEDGDYQLIIQANDISGNASGRNDYKVNFKIINEKMISNVLNYPNPFSTSTQFVYTLTGDQTPDYFKIQIFSVSGKIVKEITQHDLGPLRIGTHRTDYRWDGTDDFGDRLANGIYLYRLVVKDQNGADYKKYINGEVDSFFTEGFGKLVIMR